MFFWLLLFLFLFSFLRVWSFPPEHAKNYFLSSSKQTPPLDSKTQLPPIYELLQADWNYLFPWLLDISLIHSGIVLLNSFLSYYVISSSPFSDYLLFSQEKTLTFWFSCSVGLISSTRTAYFLSEDSGIWIFSFFYFFVMFFSVYFSSKETGTFFPSPFLIFFF